MGLALALLIIKAFFGVKLKGVGVGKGEGR